MTHRPIRLRDISFILPHRPCFLYHNAVITHGQRIGIIGNNGSGKSSLLKIVAKAIAPSHGDVYLPDEAVIGYVPQMIEDFSKISGAERFNRRLSQVLASEPNVLLLDEPTNHLDSKNRKSLTRMLKSYPHTLMIATHDVALLRDVVDIIWDIDEGRVAVFLGHFDDYMRESKQKRRSIESEISQLGHMVKQTHHALMSEQKRAKNSRLMGEKNIDRRKWPTIVSKSKARRAEVTTGRKKSQLREAKDELSERLSKLRLPEVIKPKFYLATNSSYKGALLSIRQGKIGYSSAVVENINLSVSYGDRIAIKGDNGSGKSSIIKAILNHPSINKDGEWQIPLKDDIGYLDQHYENLNPDKTVLATIHDERPSFKQHELREHLNDFLFRKNEEVNELVRNLSGGEKARLSLCKIAARSPKILLLDEITNNVDLKTREHLIQVITHYKGALIVISHDDDFLEALEIRNVFFVKDGKFCNLIGKFGGPNL